MIIAIHDQDIALKGVTYEVQPGVFVEIDSGTLEDAKAQYAARPKLIPRVTPRQIRQALNIAGLRDLVEQAVAASSQDVKDWWEFASFFERNHPLVIAVAQQIGQDPSQVDILFTEASKL